MGKKISAKAVYTDVLGTAEAVSSTQTALVANVNDAPTGSVTLTGTATQGQTLTASNTIADADGLGAITYQWLRDATLISGASAATYTLAQADVGTKISVKAVYIDALGTTEAVSSAQTPVVLILPSDAQSASSYVMTETDINLILTGSAAVSGTGNSQNNVIVGNVASNTVDGGDGSDMLLGREGDDALSGGLGDDTLLGGLGNDTLSGGLGNDLLNGDVGADTYLFTVGSGSDTISDMDARGGVTDVISLNITPNDLTGMERRGNNLVLSYGTGDALTVIDQFAGDAFEIEQIKFADGTTWNEAAIKSQVITNGGDLSDTLVGYDDGSNRINGLGGNDSITGGSMADTLNGGLGLDTLAGGNGDDQYFADMTTDASGIERPDMVIEANGLAGGNDTITLTGATYTLPDNVENLVMTGKVGFMSGKSGKTGIGNSAANQITGFTDNDLLQGLGGADTLFGNDGNDTLDGGLGMDSLVGGAGDDTFILKPEYDLQGKYIGFDTLVESPTAEGGTDTVESYVEAYTLAAGLENLQVKTYSGFGNDANNRMVGTDINNRLVGGAGNDTLEGLGGDDLLEGGEGNDVLIGGAGSDTLVGGLGNDTYQWGQGSGQDRIIDAGGDDAVALAADVAPEQIWLSQSGNDLLLRLLGAPDALTVEGWFLDANKHVESFRLADGRQLKDSQVQALVNAMSQLPMAANADAMASNASYANVKALVASSWA